MKIKIPLLISTVAIGVFYFSVENIFSLNIPNLPPIPGLSGQSFGGKITKIQDCDLTCGTRGKLITVGSPKGGKFRQTPSTKTYDHKEIEEGNWVVGLSSGSEKECKKRNITKSILARRQVCDNKGKGKEIKIIGTSK